MAKRGTNQLEDLQIKRWIAKGEPIAKSDGGGLTFTLSRAGTASWVLRYMRDAKARELTIGNYPDISLAAARKIAREKRGAIDGGQDPAAQKKEARMKSKMAWTVNALIKDYTVKRLVPPDFAEGTIYYRKSDFTNDIGPTLGTLNVTDVTPAHVVHMLEKSEKTWAVQKRILTSTTQIFDHAIGKQLIHSNPCAAIKLAALMGKRPAPRKRVMLSEQDLRKLLSSIADIGTENALAFRIMLATCVRSVELVKAKWADIDFDRATWFVPDESVKTRTGFLVPLTPTVLNWFGSLRDLSDGSEWVLPSRRPSRAGQHVGRTTLWAAITRAFERGDIEIQRFTPHDTRSTAKGHMRNMGISREISEIALNHALKGMEGIYDVREEIPERRRALEQWALFLVACEFGRPDNVLALPLQAEA
ncbi:tyrosine-type recombinase/integrase [Janthinobacterium sp. PLB04]|uniref:Tyrosine-type recombinase/integrase n=1 Tax=Janthinobacterium lividum TaxID=29581 RepID=A0AAJ4MVN0_9BURK|nr:MULTISPECIES: site-specific integrase [Janthinobacterium]KAB0331790.1 tyrosine-type recombinase/integrase [Janthinobacterium lividum]QSX97990.1 tyrosine-type recombinase/integrase [Janthinobacterium lividum]UGQ37961.1 tyrosine-type recombinase/integrase [Janthinobacterium sp. PLB04]